MAQSWSHASQNHDASRNLWIGYSNARCQLLSLKMKLPLGFLWWFLPSFRCGLSWDSQAMCWSSSTHSSLCWTEIAGCGSVCPSLAEHCQESLVRLLIFLQWFLYCLLAYCTCVPKRPCWSWLHPRWYPLLSETLFAASLGMPWVVCTYSIFQT